MSLKVSSVGVLTYELSFLFQNVLHYSSKSNKAISIENDVIGILIVGTLSDV
jgi:hypothetical protein